MKKTVFYALLMAVFLCNSMLSAEVARIADDFVESIGINIRLYNTGSPEYTDYTNTRSLLVQSGIRHVRERLPFSNETVYKQRAINLAEDYGIYHCFGIDTRSSGALDTSKIDAALNIAEEMLPAIDSFVGPNEYNLTGRSDWISELRTYTEQLDQKLSSRQALQNFAVVAPPISGNSPTIDFGDVSDWVDYGNGHLYLNGDKPENNSVVNQFVSSVRDAAFPDRDLIATEGGYHSAFDSGNGISELARSKYIPRTYLDFFRRGIVRTYLYTFRDARSPNRSDREAHFGLVTYDGIKTESYNAVKNLITILQEPSMPDFTAGELIYSLSGETSDVEHLLLQKSNGNFYLVLWLAKRVYTVSTDTDLNNPNQQVTIQIDQPLLNQQVTVYENIQNPTFSTSGQNTSNGRVTVDVSDAVTILKIEALPLDTYYYLKRKGSSNELALASDTQNNGNANAESFSNAEDHLWEEIDAGSGYVNLRNKKSGRYLNVSGASTINEANIAQWNSNSGSHYDFKFIQDGNHWRIQVRHSGKYLGTYSNGNGTNVHQTSTINDKVRWSRVTSGNYLKLQRKGSNIELALANDTQANANVNAESSANLQDHQWELLSTGNGYFHLRNVKSGMYLNVTGGNTAETANVAMWRNPSGSHYEFELIPEGSFFRIKARHSGKYLGTIGNSNGTNVQQTAVMKDNSLWEFQ
jgi:hypothetical protein